MALRAIKKAELPSTWHYNLARVQTVLGLTRYTVHGRGAKLELLRNTDDSTGMDPFQTWNQSKNMRMELRPSYVSAYARIRKIETTVILALFLPVKSHGHFLQYFSKKSLFFRPKKGSPNRPIPVANASLGGSFFGTRKIDVSNYR